MSGDFGHYQMRQYVLHLLAAMTAGLHMLSLVTVAAVPQHRCRIPALGENDSFALNASIVDLYIPRKQNEYDSCNLLDAQQNLTYPCDSWVYDTTYYQQTRTTEWNLVCGRRWMGAIAQTVYLLGVFTGAVTLGSMADKYGRKTIFVISAVLQVILGIGVAFVQEYYSLLVVRFLYGIFGSAGCYVTGFVLTMELVGRSKRTMCGIMTQVAFAFGTMLVAFWGFLIADRRLLQVVYGLHGLLLFPHYWWMDESPRWLWAQGKVHKAVTIVERALCTNKCADQLDVTFYVSRGQAAARKRGDRSYTIADLFRTPNMRYRALNVCLNWFANSLVFYGLSLNTGKLNGNPFLVLFLVCLVELPSYALVIMVMDRTGRRSLISSFLVMGGLACLISTYISQDTDNGNVWRISVVMIGKFFISGSFAIIFNYTAEMFPTVVRNTSIGVGSMCARLSSAMTPLITLLDSLDKTLPSLIFASTAILSGLLSLLLPETLNQPMPQTLADGEKFGNGDTAFSACCKRRKLHCETQDVQLASAQ
ncbi:organic cation transporter protein isoform X2 [Bacillus rossius redtenbacheri]|uniref:organic cation transporter protein isoform X2 n=1 Tax=Bacillus rossius redtenbacheri TaxID=93214 RepID=UPI002FDC95EF